MILITQIYSIIRSSSQTGSLVKIQHQEALFSGVPAADSNWSVTGRSAFPCFVGIGHNGYSSNLWRLSSKVADVIFIDISCFCYPFTCVGRTAFNTYHNGVGCKCGWDNMIPGEFIGPKIVNDFGFPEKQGRKGDINPCAVIIF